MHNYYMWHGGNHYANWSTADPGDAPLSAGAAAAPPPRFAAEADVAGPAPAPVRGPSSSDNTVRYANAAPLRSDGSRHEPLFSLLATVHATFLAHADALLSQAEAHRDCPTFAPMRWGRGVGTVTSCCMDAERLLWWTARARALPLNTSLPPPGAAGLYVVLRYVEGVCETVLDERYERVVYLMKKIKEGAETICGIKSIRQELYQMQSYNPFIEDCEVA